MNLCVKTEEKCNESVNNVSKQRGKAIHYIK